MDVRFTKDSREIWLTKSRCTEEYLAEKQELVEKWEFQQAQLAGTAETELTEGQKIFLAIFLGLLILIFIWKNCKKRSLSPPLMAPDEEILPRSKKIQPKIFSQDSTGKKFQKSSEKKFVKTKIHTTTHGDENFFETQDPEIQEIPQKIFVQQNPKEILDSQSQKSSSPPQSRNSDPEIQLQARNPGLPTQNTTKTQLEPPKPIQTPPKAF